MTLLNRLITIFFCSIWVLTTIAQEKESFEVQYVTEEGHTILSLTQYRPIYFIYGSSPAKMEFSFKYQLSKSFPLYFAYTQLMFWDLKKHSKPFRDIIYHPDFFYRLALFPSSRTLKTSIDLGPLGHLSNGRDDLASRSLNTFFIQFNFLFPLNQANSKTIALTTRLTHIYAIEKNNSNIRNYMSPLDLKLTLTQNHSGIFDQSELSFHFFPGGKYANDWSKGGRELGLSFRLGGLDMTPSLYLQYYNGYMESLLNYDQYENKLRVGISL